MTTGDAARGGARVATRRRTVVTRSESAQPWALRWPDPVHAAAFVLGTAVFVLRGLPRFVHPGTWAEDGTRFFPESHDYGIGSLTHPFAGYVHVLPRLIALALTQVPLRAVPEAYTVAAAAAAVLIFSTVLSPRLHWLIPSRWARALVFLLICLVPDISEPYGNLANLIFVGAVATFFLGLSDDARTVPGRALEMLAVLVLMLSGPLGFAALPVFVLRVWRLRTRWSVAMLAAWAVGGGLQLSVYLRSARATPGGGTPKLLAQALAIRLPGTWMFGSAHWREDWLHGHLALYGTVWLAVVVLVALVTLRWAGVAILAVGALAIGVMVAAYGPQVMISGLDRHLLLPQVVAVTAAVAAAARWAARARPEAVAGRPASAGVGRTRQVAGAAPGLEPDSPSAVAGAAEVDAGAVRAGRGPLARAGRSTAVVLAVLSITPVLAGALGVARDAHVAAYPRLPHMAALQPCLKTLSDRCSTPESPLGAWNVVVRRGG